MSRRISIGILVLALLLLPWLVPSSAGAITPKPTEGVTITLNWVGVDHFSVTGKITTSRIIASRGFEYRRTGYTEWTEVPYDGKANPFTTMIGGTAHRPYEVRAYCAFSKTELIYSKILSLTMRPEPEGTISIVDFTHNTITVDSEIDPLGNLIRLCSIIIYYPGYEYGREIKLGENITVTKQYRTQIPDLVPGANHILRLKWVAADNPDQVYTSEQLNCTLKPAPTATPIPTAAPTATPRPTATQAPTATPKPTSVATPVPTSPGDPTATAQPTATNPPDPTATQAPEPTTTEPTTAEPTTADPTDPAATPTEGEGGPITITDAVTQPESQGGLFGDMGGGALALIVGLAAAVLLVLGILVGKLGRKA